jgi:hypothetical protein
MSPIRVPPRHRDAIRQVARINDEEFSSLLAALVPDVDEQIIRSQFNAQVGGAVGLDSDDSSVLMAALIGAHSVQLRRNGSPEEIAQGIAGDPLLKLDDTEKTVLSDRLSAILKNEPLSILARATQLLGEEGQRFCTAITLSDLRPVFTKNSEPEAIGLVIKHTIKIDYHTNGPETESFFVTVDDHDLLVLRESIDRALAKGRAMRTIAKSSGKRVIDVEDSH